MWDHEIIIEHERYWDEKKNADGTQLRNCVSSGLWSTACDLKFLI